MSKNCILAENFKRIFLSNKHNRYIAMFVGLLLLQLLVINLATPVTQAASPRQANYNYYLPFLANNYQPSGINGQFSTSLTVQNTGATPVTFQKQYYDANGNVGAAASITLPAGAQWSDNTPVANGAEGTGVISSDQPLNVLVVEITPFGGSAYAVTPGSASTLVAPLAINNALGGFSTQLTILNTGSTSTTAWVAFYDTNGYIYNQATKNINIGPHSSVVLDQSNNSGLPDGFYGWAQILGASGGQLVAQVLEQRPSSHFTALVNASSSVSTNLYAPAIFHDTFGGFSTGTNIVNPNSNSVTVNIIYYDNLGNAYTTNSINLGAFAVAPIYQGANSGGTGLPSNGLSVGFYGSATVTSQGGGVVMVVNEAGNTTPNGAAQSGTYMAIAGGSNTVGLPIVTRNGNPGFGGVLMTGATVLNSSGGTVNGTIQYYQPDGSKQGNGLPFSINAHSSLALYQGDSGQALSDGFAGTAIVNENGGGNDLVVATNAQSNNFFYTYTESSNPSIVANLLTVPTTVGTTSPPNNYGMNSEEVNLFNLINQYRRANNLPALILNQSLVNAAKWLSNDMATKNYFSHTDSLGRNPTQRGGAFGYLNGVGENIAAGQTTAQDVFNAWKNSPGHNANMLNPAYTTIGVGSGYVASSTYGWYWTTDFGL